MSIFTISCVLDTSSDPPLHNYKQFHPLSQRQTISSVILSFLLSNHNFQLFYHLFPHTNYLQTIAVDPLPLTPFSQNLNLQSFSTRSQTNIQKLHSRPQPMPWLLSFRSFFLLSNLTFRYLPNEHQTNIFKKTQLSTAIEFSNSSSSTFSSFMSPSSCTISSFLLSCSADILDSSSSFRCLSCRSSASKVGLYSALSVLRACASCSDRSLWISLIISLTKERANRTKMQCKIIYSEGKQTLLIYQKEI